MQILRRRCEAWHRPLGGSRHSGGTKKDATPEEFDPSALKAGKVIAGVPYGTVQLHPLAPGRCPLMGEFHPDAAAGTVISE